MAITKAIPQLAIRGQRVGAVVGAIHHEPAVDVVGITAGVPHGEVNRDAVGIAEGDVDAGENAVVSAGVFAGAGLFRSARSEGRVDWVGEG